MIQRHLRVWKKEEAWTSGREIESRLQCLGPYNPLAYPLHASIMRNCAYNRRDDQKLVSTHLLHFLITSPLQVVTNSIPDIARQCIPAPFNQNHSNETFANISVTQFHCTAAGGVCGRPNRRSETRHHRLHQLGQTFCQAVQTAVGRGRRPHIQRPGQSATASYQCPLGKRPTTLCKILFSYKTTIV